MPEITIDAAGANESPSTPSAPAEPTPTAVASPKAARKPVKRSAEPKAAQVTAEAAKVTPAKIAKTDKAAKLAKAVAPARAVKPSKVSKAVAAAPVKSVKPVKVAKPVKPAQPAPLPEVTQPKPKLVRDSFTIPELEYAQLEALKRRALALAHHVKKSELLRAGIATMAAMGDAQLLAALQSVPSLKTGRPKKPKADKAAVKARNGGKKS